ncbi:hypothetical protein [Cupriavidus sp. Agwp_2]|uniref:hypothetical protein n=1 Tax=Cupriavidus sp. Agwp_2 TaxID=2897324 RepID=UPI00346080BC
MTAALTQGCACRMPSGRKARFVSYVPYQKAYKFVYVDDGSEIRHRVFFLTEANLRLAVPEVGP